MRRRFAPDRRARRRHQLAIAVAQVEFDLWRAQDYYAHAAYLRTLARGGWTPQPRSENVQLEVP
jgi:hypothetical protein